MRSIRINRCLGAVPVPALIIALAALLAVASPPPAVMAAETNFSGELKPEVIFNIPGSRGYDESPLNPGNQWGYDDLMFRSQIDLKMESSGESAALDLWFQLKQYPMADLLTGSAAIAETLSTAGSGELAGYSGAVADLFAVVDPYIFALDIMRASVAWMPIDSLRFTLGRQSFLTGYGYGWNPADLANPPKDPTDPEAYLRGVDALNIQYSPVAWLNARFYGALPSQGGAWGYEDVLAGGELTFNAPALEFKAAGLWGGVESSSDASDPYPHAGAAAVYADIFGLGVYGEAVLRSRSRRNTIDSGGSESIKAGPVLSALGGMEYYFPSGLSLAVEYFYNGEGWDSGERRDYVTALKAMDPDNGGEGVSGEALTLYSPTYFARHYILVNLNIPWYAIEATFNINAVWSVDSGAFIFTPNATFNLNYDGTLVSEIWYTGQFCFVDSENDETSLAPVRHSAWVNLRYYF